MAEIGGMTNHGGSAATMVNIVDEKMMKPNETSLGGNKLVSAFRACAGLAAGASQVVKST